MAPSEQPLKFQGQKFYPLEDKVDDWGYTPEQVETKVEQFRRLLEERKAWREKEHDFHTMLRFLRARKYDMDAATLMWTNMLKWREEHGVDALLESFTFHEKEQFLMCYPQGYHKVDKFGRPVYIQHLGSINLDKIKQVTTEERMIKFHIQEYERCIHQILPICSHLQKRQIDQTFGILDIKGVGLSHLSGEVKRILGIITKYDQDNYPEMLGHICIINAPFMFKPIWSLIKPLLDARTQNKIEICSSNYTPDLLKWIDSENLPTYLGGTSKGTLLDDVGPWSDSETLNNIDFAAIRPPIPHHLLPAEISSRMPSPSITKTSSFKPSPLPPLPEAPVGEFVSTGTHLQSSPSSNGNAGYYSEEDNAFYSPRSDASNVSFGSAVTSVTSYEQPLLGEKGQRPASNLGRATEAPAGQVASFDSPTHSTSPDSIPSRAKSLVDRIKAVEQVVSQQKERLRPYIQESQSQIADAASFATSLRTAPQGTLLWRVENLEEGVELLLAAQELSWKTEAQGKGEGKERCCGGCSIM